MPKRMLFWCDVIVALLGAALLVLAAWMIYPPAGVALLGLVLLTGAYARRALEVMNGTS